MTPPAKHKPSLTCIAARTLCTLRNLLGVTAVRPSASTQPGRVEHRADYGRGYIDALLSPG